MKISLKVLLRVLFLPQQPGSAKPKAKDRRKFYYISLTSLREVQAILNMIGHFDLEKQADRLGACLYKLCRNA